MATKTEQAQSTRPITRFGEFKPITGSTAATLHVLETKADHPTSMRLLDSAGLTPFTEREILGILVKDKKLRDYLKGKWFYLEGTGIEKQELYTINEDGSLTKGEGQSIENTVHLWQGNNPLLLSVHTDDDARVNERRFDLDAYYSPDNAAPVVVGKPKLNLSKQVNALLIEVETAAGNLRRNTTPEELAQNSAELKEKAENLTKMLRPTKL